MTGSSLQPPDRTPLRESLADAIARSILAGDFVPGDRVKDTELAAQLGASRTPVREALLRLVERGYLRNEPGRGFRVAPMSEQEAAEIYELIRLLEVHALRTAAPCRPEQAARLEELRIAMASADNNTLDTLLVDESWHATLLEGASNQRLQASVRRLRRQATRYEASYFESEQGLEDSLDEHAEIVHLYAAGQQKEAAALLEAHWLRSQDLTLALIRQSPSETQS